MLTVINNAIVIDKKTNKLKKFVQVPFVRMIFVGTAFIVFMISSNMITDLSIILRPYLPCLQLHEAGFQI